jgi:hypothetical protein
MISYRNAGVWNAATFVRKWNGTAFVDVTFVKVWDGSAWITKWPVTSNFTVSSSTSFVSGAFDCFYDNTPPNTCPIATTITSTSVTVSSTGGTGAGPTYLWEYVSGDTSISVSNTTATTVTFSGIVTRRNTKTARWKCTVTRGTETSVVYVDVELTYSYFVDGEQIP